MMIAPFILSSGSLLAILSTVPSKFYLNLFDCDKESEVENVSDEDDEYKLGELAKAVSGEE
ncbi:MAG: hypothetical protein RSA29_14375 [Clostridium sp.]|uniref:hypothetical protein n=1 Tax=Clostridium sp. TaxID=1506 RepID=UPI0032174B3E